MPVYQQTLDMKIRRLSANAVMPMYQKPGDAGMDLVATDKSEIDLANNTVTYGTGISVEIPVGYVGLIFPRSSIHKYNLSLANSVGVIDSGYRGEIMVKFRLTGSGKSGKLYDVGDRIAQLIIIPYPKVNLIDSDNLTDTERGKDGFGSTGR